MKGICTITLFLLCSAASAQPPASLTFKVFDLSRYLHPKTLLLIGTGPSATRSVLSGISENLIVDLKQRGIHAEFQFYESGKSGELLVTDMLKQNFDAILYILPVGTAYFGFKEGAPARPGHGSSIGKPRTGFAYSRIPFNQKFRFVLYAGDEDRALAAEARAEVWCDPGRKSSLKSVSAKLLEGFRTQYFFKTDSR